MEGTTSLVARFEAALEEGGAEASASRTQALEAKYARGYSDGQRAVWHEAEARERLAREAEARLQTLLAEAEGRARSTDEAAAAVRVALVEAQERAQEAEAARRQAEERLRELEGRVAAQEASASAGRGSGSVVPLPSLPTHFGYVERGLDQTYHVP